MTIPRIYQATELTENTEILLSDAAAHHVSRVIRMQVGDPLIIFNGEGGEYASNIVSITKKAVCVELNTYQDINTESPLTIHLVQAISRAEKMDFTIQKAVELGVSSIAPIISERCGVKLSAERMQKKCDHWRGIVISACEQCGRNRIPQLNPILPYSQWLAYQKDAAVILDPNADATLKSLSIDQNRITLVIGPEGGLSESEITSALNRGFESVNLGPRILRTETAALTAISILQSLWGDL